MSPSFTPPRTFVAERTNLVSISAVMERQLGLMPALQSRTDARSTGSGARTPSATPSPSSVCASTRSTRSIYLAADGSDGKYTQVMEHLVEVWDELAQSGPTDAEWSDMQRSYLSHRGHPQARVAELDGDAERQVLGLPYVPDDEIWERGLGLDHGPGT